MKVCKVGAALVVASLVSACVTTTETVRFEPSGPTQQAMNRDGRPSIVSKRKGSIVMVSPAGRAMTAGARPVFVLAMTNVTGQPIDFSMANVAVHQKGRDGMVAALPVKTYENLVQEERNRQVASAIAVGLLAGANAAVAANAGYGTARSTYVSPSGRVHTFSTNYYSPTANAIAQANASAQNAAMVANSIEAGRQNMAALEQQVIKDHTVMPGEWYGGQLHFEAPRSDDMGAAKAYTISVTLGSETHEVEVVQERVPGA